MSEKLHPITRIALAGAVFVGSAACSGRPDQNQDQSHTIPPKIESVVPSIAKPVGSPTPQPFPTLVSSEIIQSHEIDKSSEHYYRMVPILASELKRSADPELWQYIDELSSNQTVPPQVLSGRFSEVSYQSAPSLRTTHLELQPPDDRVLGGYGIIGFNTTYDTNNKIIEEKISFGVDNSGRMKVWHINDVKLTEKEMREITRNVWQHTPNNIDEIPVTSQRPAPTTLYFTSETPRHNYRYYINEEGLIVISRQPK